MSFVSIAFLTLYVLALALRWGPGRDRSLRIAGLLALSWIFYAWHVPHLIVLILFSTLTDYLAALWKLAPPFASE